MIRILPLRKFTEKDGDIVPIEFEKELPFKPVRMFYIWNVPNGAMRGGHAHKQCEQILICLRGNFVAEPLWRENNGTVIVQPHLMLDLDKALYVPAKTWLELRHFTADAICLVLASRPYETDDYIHHKEELGL